MMHLKQEKKYPHTKKEAGTVTPFSPRREKSLETAKEYIMH